MKRPATIATTAAPPPEPGAAKFRLAARMLWVVAILQIVAGGILLALANDEADSLVAGFLREKQVTIYEVKAIPAEKRAEWDRAHQALTSKLRMWHGCDLLAGLLTLGCAIYLRRAPVAATICPLVLFFFVTALKATFLGMPLGFFFARVVVLYALIAALVAVLAARKQRRTAGM
jgi:hypothetical protein